MKIKVNIFSDIFEVSDYVLRVWGLLSLDGDKPLFKEDLPELPEPRSTTIQKVPSKEGLVTNKSLCKQLNNPTSQKQTLSSADLEKAASGASGACGHFVRNHAILRTF